MLCFLSACVQRFECFLYHKINSCLFHFVCFNVGGLFLFSIFSELHRRFIKYFMNKNFSLWMDLWSAKFSNLGCFFFFFFNCLKVLPSLDLSFQINPCPSRLHEFLVRMDIINKTSSEVFQIHQLSSIGQSWELSLLQPVDTMFPSRALMPSQALSCFFVLKVFTRG